MSDQLERVKRIWWCSDWHLTMTIVQEGYDFYVKDPVTLRSPCTEDRWHSGSDCGWRFLVKELEPLPYAKDAVSLWHEYGLSAEFLEGMSYNHRVQLVEAAHRYNLLSEGV